MPTSAVGNKASLISSSRDLHSSRASACALPPARHALGFTLIELLVVIALIAIGTAAVSFSLRDSAQTALFESARARSRSSGVPVQWRPVVEGSASAAKNASFVFEGLPPQTLPGQWLSPQTQVAANSLILLGPDPIIGPQSVMLRSQDFKLWVRTDGIQAFSVSRAAP